MADFKTIEDLQAVDWTTHCQEAAFHWLMMHSTHTLIHCRIKNPEGTILHAFCHDGESVYDLTTKGILKWNKDVYFKRFEPFDVIEYSYDQALWKNALSMTYGFWEL